MFKLLQGRFVPFALISALGVIRLEQAIEENRTQFGVIHYDSVGALLHAVLKR